VTKVKSSEKQTFRYKSALIFSLTSILPLLLFLLVLENQGLIQNPKVVMFLGFSVGIAVVGFVFFHQIVRQVNTLASDFLRVESGEINEITVREEETPQEFSEMARIADAFNKTLTDLKSHTRELENLVDKLTTLSDLTGLVSRIPNIQEVLQMVLERTMSTVNARIGSIMLLDDNKQNLSIAAAVGLDESIINKTAINLGEGIAGKVAQTGEAVLVEDVEKDERFRKTNDPKYESSSFICMPLRARWQVMGVLNLSKKGDRKTFSESDLKFLNTMLGHIGFALENARLLKEAKEAANKLRQVVNQQSHQLNEAQQRILQSVKLSALGQLIAGVAHELNNPLTTVVGRSQLLLEQVQDEETKRDLEKIMEQGQRAAKIVKNLLSFAREKPPEKRPCNINDIFYKILEVSEHDLLIDNIELKTEMTEKLPPIMADPDQIQQVLLNIVTNAHQAMMEKDRPRTLTVRTSLNGKHVLVEIIDTGPGIPSEHQEHIFEPFFTTKAGNDGTGLGLSISYGIIKSHEGNISVESKEGKGTKFLIELPILEDEAIDIEEENNATKETKLDIRKILVIDDEETVNELITDILKKEGYNVDAAHNGTHGLQKIKEEEYDLVVCDLRMPGMDGRQLYKETRELYPRLSSRFIFLTGDSVSEETRTFLEGSGNPYIIKPFAKDAFVETVQEAWEKLV